MNTIELFEEHSHEVSPSNECPQHSPNLGMQQRKSATEIPPMTQNALPSTLNEGLDQNSKRKLTDDAEHELTSNPSKRARTDELSNSLVLDQSRQARNQQHEPSSEVVETAASNTHMEDISSSGLSSPAKSLATPEEHGISDTGSAAKLALSAQALIDEANASVSTPLLPASPPALEVESQPYTAENQMPSTGRSSKIQKGSCDKSRTKQQPPNCFLSISSCAEAVKIRRSRQAPVPYQGLVSTLSNIEDKGMEDLEPYSDRATSGTQNDVKSRPRPVPSSRKSSSAPSNKLNEGTKGKPTATKHKQPPASAKKNIAASTKDKAAPKRATKNSTGMSASKASSKTRKRADRPKATATRQKSSRAKQTPPSPKIRLKGPPLVKANNALLKLSAKLTRREDLGSKPEPQGLPEVWAASRQALCETVPYFKSPQSGTYQNDGHVYGFLFDSVGHCREYMDENTIICRAGGSMELDGSGGMVQKKDHSMQEAQVQAVLNDIAHQNPIVVICGNRNKAAKCKMPHQYCVLGWYKPVLVWSEKTAGKGKQAWTTIKYRLERLNQHDIAWHAPNSAIAEIERVTDGERDLAGELIEKVCQHCEVRSPQVYLRFWMCLNGTCGQFWKINGVDASYGTTNLEYNPAFLLKDFGRWSEDGSLHEPEPAPLRPALPDFGNVLGDNLTYINTRGICCPRCGRCNSRRQFKGWECENPACDFELRSIHQPVVSTMLHTPWDTAPTLLRNRSSAAVTICVEHRYGYKISTYTFQGIEGRFIHAAATRPILEEAKGANAMFSSLQTEDMGLERRTFATKKAADGALDLSGTNDVKISRQDVQEPQAHPQLVQKSEFADGDLMTAFSMNYGMPYKFVASGVSKPFEEAPWPVSEARRRLNWATKVFLNKPDEDMDLNEELIFAYLEGQKIEYHDDGEEGLGPRIATFSLGGRAKMHMRMKTKHYVGCTKTGILIEERPIPGSLEFEKRLEKWHELQQVKDNSTLYNQRRKELPKDLGIFEKRTKKADDLVTVTLSHGDIVIMDGYDIQKYLEHKVVPEGYLRFALTCRTVLENHLKPEERPAYEVLPDEETYDGPQLG